MGSTDVVSAICDVVTAGAAGFGAWIAYGGIETWRKQLVGQDEFNLAKRILKGVFEVENLIGRIRQEVSSEDQALLWNRFDELTAELDVTFLEGRVLWEDALSESKAKLKACVAKLRRSTRWFHEIERKRDQMRPAEYDKLRTEHEPIVWAMEDDDDFARDLHAAVTAIEGKLRPHLNR